MTQQIINLSTNHSNGSGDTVRSSFLKINHNFSEIFGTFPVGFQGNTAQQLIILSSAPGARDGDQLRVAFTKINNNFANVWTNFTSEAGQALAGNVLVSEQQIINLGSGPNTNTGDTVAAALDKVNKNFSNLYSLLGLGVDNSITYGAYVPRRFTPTVTTQPTISLFSVASDAGITPSTTFQPIDLGNGPDTQTGDTVYEAFTKINENFAQLYEVLGPEGYDIVANTITSNNIVNSGNIRANNMFAYHEVVTNGNIVGGGFFYPNGVPVTGQATNFSNIQSSVIPGANVIYTLGNVGFQWQSLYVGSNVVIDGAELTTAGGQLYINGSLISGNYGNANVAAYLPTYSGNVNANYYFGNGSLLTGIGSANTAVSSGTAQYVTGNSQPNITSVGILNGLTLSNTLIGTVINASIIGNTGTTLIGNGAALTGIAGGNVSGTVANAYYATQSGQANYANTATYVTGLTRTNVNVALGYVPLDSNATALTAQYVTQAAQANITSVGTLTGLTLSGTLTGTTVNAATIGNVNASIVGNGSGLYSITGANISGIVANTTYAAQAGQANYANTATYVTGLTGTNVNVALGYVPLNSNATALTAQYVTQAAQANITSVGVLTGLTLSGTLIGTTVNAATIGNVNAAIVGNGSGLYSITGANVSGTVANATYAAQAGQANYANTAIYVTGLTGTNVNVALGYVPLNSNATALTAQYVTQAAQANITSVGTLTGLTLSGTLTGTTLNAATIGNVNANIVGNGSGLYSINGANVSGTVANTTYAAQAGQANYANTAIYVTGLTGTNVNVALGYVPLNSNATALTAQYVTQAAQANITSVGTLTGLTLSGTLSGTTLQAATIGNTGAAITGATVTGATAINGPLNGTLGSAGGNTAIVTTLSATSNATVAGLTSNSSITAQTTLSALGGIQNTPIGNGTASTGQFTTVSATGNVTAAGLTSNATITAQTTLSALGGIQNTPIGNVTPSTGQFTTVSATGNVTGAALTANGSMTVGTTLGVTGNATIGNISSVGRIISNDTTNATGTGTGAFIVVGGGSVTKDFWVGGNLYTTNLIAQSTSNITVQDPLLYLTANTPYPYNYEIGFYSQFDRTGTDYQHTGFIRDHTDNVWKLVSNVAEPTSVVDFTNANVIYDSIKTGPITALGAIAGNSSLNVYGTATVGNLISNGAISGGSISFTDANIAGNLTANGLTINTSAVIGTTLQAIYGIQNTAIGNVTASTGAFTTLSATGTFTGTTINAATIGNVNADIVGNGSGLYSITGANVTGTVANATYSTQAGQANYANTAIYVTGLTGTNVNVALGYVPLDSNATALTAQYVTQAAQANITSVGVLTGLALSGTLTGTTVNAATIGNVNADIVGNGAGLYSINGANVSGTVANTTYAAQAGQANYANTAIYVTGLTGTNVNVALGYIPLNSNATALTAQYVTQAAQANITSVGVLTGLTLSGTLIGTTINAATIGNVAADIVGNGSGLYSITGANVSGTVANAVYATQSGQANYANTAIYVTGLTGTNVNVALGYVPLDSNATALTAQYVTQAAQANITSVGVLTGLTLSGTLIGTTLQAATIGNTGAAITGATITGSTAINGPLNGTLGSAGGNTAIVTTLSATGTATVNSLVSNTSIATSTSVTSGSLITGTINANANATVSALSVNNSATVGTTLGVVGNATVGNLSSVGNVSAVYFFGNGRQLTGLAATSSETAIYVTGNAQPNITSVGVLTGVTISGNATTNALTVNNSATVGGTLGVTGNINGSSLTLTGSETVVGSLSAAGGLQATPIGNAVASTGQFTTLSATGNVTGDGLTSNGSITAQTTLSAAGGIQNTPIGNGTASTGQFTTLSATGNITGAGLTSNGSITAVTTISGLGGLQNTPIGNLTPSTGNFTTLNASTSATAAALTVNGAATVGTTLVTGANATVNALTVNNSGTIGGTLGVTGAGIISGGLQNTPIGNATPSTALFTTVGASSNATVAALTVNGSATVGTTLGVTGNVTGSYFIGNGSQLTGLTLSNSLTDVAITSPNVSQVLTYNGVNWVNADNTGTVSAGAGVTFYFSTPIINAVSANTDIQVDSLSLTPNTAAQSYANVSVNGTAVVNALVSPALGRTVFDAGSWDFSVWANISNTSGTNTINCGVHQVLPGAGTVTVTGTGTSRTVTASTDAPFANVVPGSDVILSSYVQTPKGIYRVTAKTSDTVVTINVPSTYTNETAVSASVWVPLFNVGSTTFISTSFTEYLFSTTQPQWNVTANSALGVLVTATTGSAKNIYVTLNGTNQSSHVLTPLHTLHDDLAGLQGGQSSEYYHLTLSEYTGTGTGTFVRSTNPVLINPNIDGATGTSLTLTGNVNSANASLGNLVTANYFSGNGSQLTSVAAVTATTATYVTGLTGTNVNVALGYVPLNSNATALTAQYVTQAAQSNITSVGVLTGLTSSGNITASGLTINNSGTFGTTLSAAGGIQNTPIGNVTPSTALFTTAGASGNITASALTVNNSATIGTNLSIGSNLIVTGTSTFIGNILGNTTHSANVIAQGFYFANGTPVGTGGGSGGSFSVVSNTQVGNGSQTIFPLPVANATTAGTIVSINGIVQQPFNAYSVTSGNVTFTEAPSVTDTIDFRIVTAGMTVVSVTDGLGTTGLFFDLPSSNSAITTFKTSGTESLSIQANGTLVTGNILPQANAASNIGSIGMQYNTVFAMATSAQYADLAEYYASDDVYPPGTVLDFGGVAEVTLSSNASTKIAGVVSTNPAYLMNSAYDGGGKVVAIALTGRVPCLVKGPVRKGDMMVSAGGGYARAEGNPKIGSVIGKSLENFDDEEGVIEVVVGRL